MQHHTTKFCINNTELEEFKSFFCLSNILTNTGGSKMGAAYRILKANQVFAILRSVRKSSGIARYTKFSIFNSCVRCFFKHERLGIPQSLRQTPCKCFSNYEFEEYRKFSEQTPFFIFSLSGNNRR